MRITSQFALAAVAFMIVAESAHARSIALVPRVTSSQCAVTGTVNGTTMRMTGCNVDLPADGAIVLDFVITSGTQVRNLNLEFQARDVDATATHRIYFPRAPLPTGVVGEIGSRWRLLSNIIGKSEAILQDRCDMDSSTVSPQYAEALWEIAIWGDLGTLTAPNQGPALSQLRNCACRALLFKHPSSSVVRYSVQSHKLAMCSQASATVRDAENLILNDAGIAYARLLRSGEAVNAADVIFSMQTAQRSYDILLARRSAGEDVSAQVQDLNALGFSVDRIARAQFPDLATQSPIVLGPARIEGRT